MSRWILLVAAVGAVGIASSAGPPVGRGRQSVNAPATVLYGESIIQKHGGEGETHRYDVSLNEGDFLELSVAQNQLLVALSVRAPNGQMVHSINVPDIDSMPQRLMFVAPAFGRFSIDVTMVAGKRTHIETLPLQKNGPSEERQYELRVLAIRPATAIDRERARWFAVLERAADRERLGNMEGLRQAVPLYQEAAAGWRLMGDVALETATLEPLAHLTSYFTEYHRESAAARERLAELYPQMEERWLEVHNLRVLGNEYLEGGRLADATQAVTRALELARTNGFRQSAAASVLQLSLFAFELGNYDRSRELALQAQELASAIPDPALEALSLWDLGRLDALAGDLEGAISRNTRALDLAAGNASVTSRITMWLGFYHLQRGDLDEATAHFEARLALARITVQRDQEALTRLGLGDVLRARGDRDAARQRYQESASALVRGAQPWRCMAEQRLGRLDLEDGHLDAAEARFGTMRGIATTLQHAECEAEARAGLADVAARRGDLDTADKEAGRVVEIMEAFRLATVSLESRALGFARWRPRTSARWTSACSAAGAVMQRP
jgi:tetratricopeptide (TPR) repeat protein